MSGGLASNFDTQGFIKQFVDRAKGKGPGDTVTLSSGKKFHVVHPTKRVRKQSGVQRSPAEGVTINTISPLQAVINRAKSDVVRSNSQELVRQTVKNIKRGLPENTEIVVPEKKPRKPVASTKKKPVQKKRLARDIFS